MSFKKIDKEFCLTDSSVNSYGFRLLTSGYQMAEFEKNPIGYYMHQREDGVLVRWEDFRVDGDKVYAKPVINLSNKRGQQTVDEIENGFLIAASVGHIVVLEASDEPEDKEPGQCGPTVTKWFNRECSLVDVPGNYGSLCLYDAAGELINLAAFSPKSPTPENSDSMLKTFSLAAATLTALGLGASATEADAQTAITDLVARHTQAVADLAAANTAKAAAETALANLKAETIKAKVKDLLDDASSKGKITNDLRADLENDYGTNPEGLANLLSKMQPHKSIVSQLGANSDASTVITAADWDKAFKDGSLSKLKAEDPEQYKALREAKFGKDSK